MRSIWLDYTKTKRRRENPRSHVNNFCSFLPTVNKIAAIQPRDVDTSKASSLIPKRRDGVGLWEHKPLVLIAALFSFQQLPRTLFGFLKECAIALPPVCNSIQSLVVFANTR